MFTRGPIPDPGTFPQKYDPSGYFNNPGGTNPFPMPNNSPVGAWTSGDMVLSWVPFGAGGAGRRAIWSSPVFDFRPEFRASDGRRPLAQPVHGRSTGAGAYLWVQVTGLNVQANASTGLRVTANEFAHIYDSELVSGTSPEADITTYFLGSQPSALVPFQPPGSGYPVRFWRVQVTFTYAQALVGGEPPFIMFAAVY